jgi:hypothetical protein
VSISPKLVSSICLWFFQLQALLSLKQQEISITESRAALQQGEESVKQGRAIMAFTIVTIFFVSTSHDVLETAVAKTYY